MERLPSIRAIKRKLLWEALLHAFLWGCATTMLTSIPMLIGALIHRNSLLWIWPCLIGAIAAMIAYYKKRSTPPYPLAKRLDSLGLHDRACTMLEYEDTDTVIAQLQRQDTLNVLSDLSPHQLKLRWPKRLMAVTAALLLMVLGLQAALMLLPAPVAEPDPEYLAIQAMLRSLEEQISDASLDEATRAALIQELEALKAQFNSTEQSMQEVAEMAKKAEEMLAMLQQLQKTANLAAEMLKHDLLREMGEAMYARDIQAVGVAFDHWQSNLLTGNDSLRESARDELVNAVYTALTALKDKEVGVDEAYLHYTFDTMALEAGRLAVESFEDPDKGIPIIMETAKNRVISVYNSIVVQQGETRTGEEGKDAMASGAMQQFDGEAGQPTGSGGGFGSSLQQGGTDGVQLGVGWEMDESIAAPVFVPSDAMLAGTDGYLPGKVNADGSVQRIPASESDTNGLMPYDEIYGSYYASFLERLMDGQIPETLQPTLEAYFLGL